MKLEKEDLIDGHVYLVGHKNWVYKSPRIYSKSKFYLYYRETSYKESLTYEELETIEHVNGGQGDTLQEVVDFLKKENEKHGGLTSVELFSDYSGIFRNKGYRNDYHIDDKENLLTHIRQEPKELTELKALAEKLGYNLSKKD